MIYTDSQELSFDNMNRARWENKKSNISKSILAPVFKFVGCPRSLNKFLPAVSLKGKLDI
jgi:hypothetical protein